MSESRADVISALNGILTRLPWTTQLLRFGSVGVLATLVHIGAYVGFVELLNMPPIISNVVAFLVALVISFAGQAGWTFRDQYQCNRNATHVLFIRFAISAVLGLLLNSFIVLTLVTWAELPYGWAIPFFLFITPLALYVVNRLWVFQE